MLTFRQPQLACNDFVWEWRDLGAFSVHLTGGALVGKCWGMGIQALINDRKVILPPGLVMKRKK